MSTPSSHDLQKMLIAGLHFGHKTNKWNPKVKPFLFGEKNGVHLFDLEKTAEYLDRATAFLEKQAAAGKVILLVSTKPQTIALIQQMAEALGLPYITEKWYGGMLTNWNTTKTRLKELRDMKAERDATGFAKYRKNERTKKLKEIARLELWFHGIESLEKKPDVVFVIDTVCDKLAVREANLCKIPVVGILDSNANPDLVQYPIPGNDDAQRAVEYVVHAVGDAIERGHAGIGTAAAATLDVAAQ